MRVTDHETTVVLDGLRRLVKVLRESSREAEQLVGLSRLVKAKLVQRVRAEDDARRLELALTTGGRQLHDKAPHLITAVQLLSMERRRSLGEGLTQVAQLMALPDSPSQMFFEEDAPTKPKRKQRR